jgi:hypothetical protein
MKAALRASALHEIGERFEDRLEGSSSNVASARGAVAAFAEGSRAIASLSRLLDEEIDKGEIELEQGAAIKKWITRAGAALDNLGKQSENRVILAEGALRAWREAIDLTRKAYDLEVSRIPAPEPQAEPQAEPEQSSEASEDEPKKKTRKKSIKARRQAAEAS